MQFKHQSQDSSQCCCFVFAILIFPPKFGFCWLEFFPFMTANNRDVDLEKKCAAHVCRVCRNQRRNTEFKKVKVFGSRPSMRPSVVKLESMLCFSVSIKVLSQCDRQLGDVEVCQLGAGKLKERAVKSVWSGRCSSLPSPQQHHLCSRENGNAPPSLPHSTPTQQHFHHKI